MEDWTGKTGRGRLDRGERAVAVRRRKGGRGGGGTILNDWSKRRCTGHCVGATATRAVGVADSLAARAGRLGRLLCHGPTWPPLVGRRPIANAQCTVPMHILHTAPRPFAFGRQRPATHPPPAPRPPSPPRATCSTCPVLHHLPSFPPLATSNSTSPATAAATKTHPRPSFSNTMRPLLPRVMQSEYMRRLPP